MELFGSMYTTSSVISSIFFFIFFFVCVFFFVFFFLFVCLFFVFCFFFLGRGGGVGLGCQHMENWLFLYVLFPYELRAKKLRSIHIPLPMHSLSLYEG